MGVKQMIQSINCINHAYTNFKWRERKISLGKDNQDKTFYIVRRANSNAGLFSLVLTALGHMRYAVERGYTPVVFMGDFKEWEKNPSSVINEWELFFEQPESVKIDDITNSQNIILSYGMIPDKLNFPDNNLAYNKNELNEWRSFVKRYFKIKREILEEAEKIALPWKSDRILGVLARGTDYVTVKPINHPVQPTVEELMCKVDRVVKEKQCKKIFLATEDRDIYDKFYRKYGDMLLSLNTERYITKGKENINELRELGTQDKYTLTKEYLITLVILSGCNCLVAGNTSGTIGTLLINEEYEYRYIFDLGVYQ